MLEANARVTEEEVSRAAVDGRVVERLENTVMNLKAQISRLMSGVVEAIECGVCRFSIIHAPTVRVKSLLLSTHAGVNGFLAKLCRSVNIGALGDV